MSVQTKRLKPIFYKLRSCKNAILVAEEQALSSRTIQEFVENLTIITPEGKKSLIMNAAQDTIWNQILGAREAKRPGRFICVKARREGVSTIIEAYLFADVVLRPFRYSKVVAHDWNGSGAVFRMSKTFYQHLDKRYKRNKPLQSDTNKAMEWAYPHESIFSVATANNPSLGSGELIHNLHLSEVAKWKPNIANDAIISVQQCVPTDWDTLIFWESTAFGAYNAFHQAWLDAENGDSGFTPIFLSWQSFPKYFLSPPDGWKPSHEERTFQRKYGINLSQLYWAHDTRRNKCRNSWADFHQEYPSEPGHAFKFTGASWFNPEAISDLMRLGRADGEQGKLEFPGEDRFVVWSPTEDGIITIYDHPDKNAKYVIGADIAQGIGGDYSVFHVMKCREMADAPPEQVAHFRSNRVSAADVGAILFQTGLYYNNALIGVESNGQGIGTLQILERGAPDVPQTNGGYGHLYYRTSFDKRQIVKGRQLGWNTTPQTKNLMLSHLKDVIDNQQVVVRSPATLQECAALSYDPKRNEWISTRQDSSTRLYHDDEVVSLAITMQMVLHNALFTGLDVRDGGF